MRSMFRKPIMVFFLAVILVSALFFLVPINLFDGMMVFDGIAGPVKTKLSLSYFIGIGASPEETAGVRDFYLLPMGYLLAFLLIIAFPALIAYRVHIANQQEK